ncbi:hypothetical protein D3C87_1791980 [compost metagenome]
MDDYPAVGQLQQQVFCAALHAQNRLVAQGMYLIGNGPAKTTVTHDSMKNGRAHQMRLDTATAGFYLR